MQSIAVGIAVVLDYHEDADERNEENIEKVKKNFISIKDNLGILKDILKNKLPENTFKWPNVLN